MCGPGTHDDTHDDGRVVKVVKRKAHGQREDEWQAVRHKAARSLITSHRSRMRSSTST